MGVLRMFLAFAILSHHSAVTRVELLPGSVSVRLFFIVSGFYMALILHGKYGRTGLWTFYSNRLLRLFPVYLVVAAASAVLLAGWSIHPFSWSRDFALAADWPGGFLLVVLANVLIVGQEVLFLLGVDDFGMLFWAPGVREATHAFTLALVPQAWSVALEVYFYLAAPLLVRLRTGALAGVAAASLAGYAAMVAAGPGWGAVAYRILPTQLYLFVGGILAFRAYLHLRGRSWAAPVGRVAVVAVPLVLLGLGRLPVPWIMPLAGVFVWAALPLLFAGVRDVAWDRALGNFSYPFYMVHLTVVTLDEEYLGESSLGLLGGVLAASALLWWGVDRPIDRWRQRRVARGGAMVLPPVPGAAMAAIPVVPGTAHPQQDESTR